jgi:hypothetical protein
VSIRGVKNVLGGVEIIKVGAVAPTAPVTGTLWIDTAGVGITAQPLSAELTAIAAITPSNDDVIQRKSGVWVNRSMAQLKTDLVLVKGDVGLGNVDNTSNATERAAVATLTNKTLTSPAITTPTGIVKGDVGLGNVDNTSDASKPVSTAQAAADALKQDALVGRIPFLLPLGISPVDAITTTHTPANNGGSFMIPFLVSAPFFLESVSIRSLDTTQARSWEWRLFKDVVSGTVQEIAGLNGTDSWTASVASIRTSAATTPGLVPPGIVWLVVRNTQSGRSVAVASAAPAATTASMALDVAQTITLGSALTTTLDATTGWAKLTTVFPMARLNGRVFGQGALF